MSARRQLPWGPALSSASGAPPRPLPARPRCCIRLPLKAGERFDVLIDGILQVREIDYVVVGRLVVFERIPLRVRRSLLRRRERPAAVAIRYELDGHVLVASGLVPEPL